jgi:hypothetical protein
LSNFNITGLDSSIAPNCELYLSTQYAGTPVIFIFNNANDMILNGVGIPNFTPQTITLTGIYGASGTVYWNGMSVSDVTDEPMVCV